MEYRNQLISQRVAKLEKLRELGVEPYPYRYDATHAVTDILADVDSFLEKTVMIAGRLVAIRDMGKAAFAHNKE